MATILEQFQPRVMRWTKASYFKLADIEPFPNERVFLFRGELIEMAPMGHLHFQSCNRSSKIFTLLLCPRGLEIGYHTPFETPGESVPEPDVAVFTKAQFARRPCPSEAELIVEVSHSSRALDLDKSDEYSAARVPEYWIIDVEKRSIEVYRDVVADASKPLGFKYSKSTTVSDSESIAPLLAPDVAINVCDLLAEKS